MALKVLKDHIVQARLECVPASGGEIRHILIIHRLGVVPPTEASLLIAVSSVSRKEAFWACEWLLERIKERLPVWKREWYADGEGVWKENFPFGASQPPLTMQDGRSVGDRLPTT